MFTADGFGPFFALALLVLVAFLFGNWYRTSSTPIRFDAEAAIADSETFEGFTVYWTPEGAAAHGVTRSRTPASVTR
jgi:hypothetical protein